MVLYLWGALFALALALLFAAALFESWALRARDIAVLESRARLAQRCVAASLACLTGVVLLGAPLIGGALMVGVVAWVLWWIPRAHRQLPVSASVRIAAPPDSVAAVLFDATAQPRWMPWVDRCVNETPGLLRVGSVLRQTRAVRGREVVARLRVVALEPGRRLVLAPAAMGASPDVFLIEPDEAGSRLRYSGDRELSLVGAVLSGWRLPGLKRGADMERAESLERLRVLIERARAPLSDRGAGSS